MKCTRFLSLLVLAVLSGATLARGAVMDEGGLEAEPCPAYESEYDSPEHYADQGDDRGVTDDSTYYDHGETEATADQQLAESTDGYRYEYPEETAPADQGTTAGDYGYAEQYYYKYGYQYAEPEQKYGFADEYGSAKEEYMAGLADTSGEANATPESDDTAAPETCYDDACQPGRDTLAEQSPADPAETDEVNYGSESYHSHYGSEYQDSGEAETQPLAEQATPEATGTEGPKYEFDGYHPRYGYDYHRYYGCHGYQGCQPDASPAPVIEQKTTDATTPSDSPVANDSEWGTTREATAEKEARPNNSWSPSTIIERYGYAEYLGEDYLWEAGINIEAPDTDKTPAGDDLAVEDTDNEMSGETPDAADPEAVAADSMNADEDPTSEDPSHEELEYRDSVESAMEWDETPSPNAEESEYSEAEMNDADQGPSGDSAYQEPSEDSTDSTDPQTADEATEAAWQPWDESMQHADSTPAPSSDFNYEYADPYGHYGRDYGREAEEMSAATQEQTSEPIESPAREPEVDDSAATGYDGDYDCERGLELFAYGPGELLTVADQDLLRTLAALCEEPSSVRRATLCDYLETLGMDAVDFSSRFEESTGVEALALADDLPGAAAFLASYRLVEQGELGIEEGADLLRRSLQRFTSAWLEGVTEITSEAYSTPRSITRHGSPEDDQANVGRIVGVLWTLASVTVERVTSVAEGFARQAAQTDWLALLPEWTAERSANAGHFDAFQR